MKLSCSSSSYTKRSYFILFFFWDCPWNPKFVYSNESNWTVFSYGAVFYAFEVIPIFDFVDEIPKFVRGDSKEGY